MKIAEFMREDNWTQGTDAADRNGRPVSATDPLATRWCLMGYVSKLYPSTACANPVVKLHRALDARGYPEVTITKFNDTHSFKEVRSLVEEAGV